MYYVDRFRGCITEEKGFYSPPERYYEYRCGAPGIVTESYIVNGDPSHTLEFNRSTEEDCRITDKKRKKFFEENKVSEDSLILCAYTVPPQMYELMVETNKNTRRKSMAVIEICDICRKEVSKSDGVTLDCSDWDGFEYPG